MRIRFALILVLLSGHLYSQVDEYANYDIKILKYLSELNSIENTVLKKDSTLIIYFCKDQSGLTMKSIEISARKFRVDSLLEFYDSIKTFQYATQFISIHTSSYNEIYPANRIKYYNSQEGGENLRGLFVTFCNEMKFENFSIVRVYISLPNSSYYADYTFVFSKEMEVIHVYGDAAHI